MNEIGEYIKNNKIDAVFINTELTPAQTKNLEIAWTNIFHDRTDEKRNKYLSDEENNEEKEEKDEEESPNIVKKDKKTIRVFDRFTIILQIFARRAKTRISKMQIELCFLHFLKTKLVREGGSTFSSFFNIFSGDLMTARFIFIFFHFENYFREIKLEVVSAKQRRAPGKMSGSGETQLEIERRIIVEKESKIKKELANESNNLKFLREKRKNNNEMIPKIALVNFFYFFFSILLDWLYKCWEISFNESINQ